MAPLGVAAAHALPVRQLKRAFAAVLVMACAATLAKAGITTSLLEHASQALARFA
jgi:hypothetical protein